MDNEEDDMFRIVYCPLEDALQFLLSENNSLYEYNQLNDNLGPITSRSGYNKNDMYKEYADYSETQTVSAVRQIETS